METKAPIIQRIEKLESDLEKLKQAFIDHWKWHKREEQHRRRALTAFNERLGVEFAVARNRADAQKGTFVAGPTPDVTHLQHCCPAEDGYVLVQIDSDPLDNTYARRIVSVYNGEWQDVHPEEALP